MYGKHFASMYSGSLFGKPAIVFAVWGYVIANMRPASRLDPQCYVELNPALLAATFATTVDAVLEAITTLESPDPASRSKNDDGRRLVPTDDEGRYPGPMQYRVVNGPKYRSMRDEEERRAYLRDAKRKQRSKDKDTATHVNNVNNVSNVNHGQPPSTQVEVEVEVEEEEEESKAGVADATLRLVSHGDDGLSERSESPKTDAKPKRKKPPADQHSEEYRLAQLFLSLLQKRDPHAKANLDTWSRELAPQIAERGADEIERAIRHAQGNDREAKFTRSPKSLAKNITAIVIDMNGGGQKKTSTATGGSSRIADFFGNEDRATQRTLTDIQNGGAS